EHQQEREERHEPVIGDERSEVAALVVAELLHDRHHERDRAVAALELVDPLHGARDVDHCCRSTPMVRAPPVSRYPGVPGTPAPTSSTGDPRPYLTCFPLWSCRGPAPK